MIIREIRGLYIKIATTLNKHKKAVKGSKILFLGVAYKPNIDDARESPALHIMDIVADKGGNVSYHDPYISKVITSEGRAFTSVDLFTEALAKVDYVVLTTNHKDMGFIHQQSRLIVDMRNMVKERSKKVIKL